jgi:hypothetical protein
MAMPDRRAEGGNGIALYLDRVDPRTHDQIPDRNGMVTAAPCSRPLLFIAVLRS